MVIESFGGEVSTDDEGEDGIRSQLHKVNNSLAKVALNSSVESSPEKSKEQKPKLTGRAIKSTENSDNEADGHRSRKNSKDHSSDSETEKVTRHKKTAAAGVDHTQTHDTKTPKVATAHLPPVNEPADHSGKAPALLTPSAVSLIA